MPCGSSRKPRRRLRLAVNLTSLGGAIGAALGILVLIGWATDVEALRAMLPGASNMKANTAVASLAIGLSLILSSRPPVPPNARGAAWCLLALAGIIAIATIAEYALNTSLGIDEFLFTDPRGDFGTVIAGRMSPVTAVILVVLAGAAFASLGRRRAAPLVTWLCGGVLALVVLTIFIYVFDIGTPTFLRGATQIAPITAIAMAALALGIVGLLRAANPFRVLVGPTATARLLRRLVAFILVAPLVLTSIGLAGQRLGMFEADFGEALMVVALMSLGLVAIIRSGRLAMDSETSRAALEMERDRFFELSLDMLSVTDLDGRFVRINRAWETTLGYRADELIGTRAVELVHPDDLDRTLEIARRHHRGGERLVAFQNRYRHRDGSYRWLEWMSQTEPDGVLSFGVARDITDRKLDDNRRQRRQRGLEARNLTLAERSIRDALTGLHNRRYFDTATVRLEQRWNRQPPDRRTPVSVIMFDLDNFGEVNKRHGHQAGDAVLRQFGALVGIHLRENDLVARYGGEEFVAVLEGARAADARRVADSIRAAFAGFPIDIGTDAPIRVTVSAGCAELHEGDDVAAGIRAADVWLATAKRGGRNQVVGAGNHAGSQEAPRPDQGDAATR